LRGPRREGFPASCAESLSVYFGTAGIILPVKPAQLNEANAGAHQRAGAVTSGARRQPGSAIH